jgi:hypothetical protein
VTVEDECDVMRPRPTRRPSRRDTVQYRMAWALGLHAITVIG